MNSFIWVLLIFLVEWPLSISLKCQELSTRDRASRTVLLDSSFTTLFKVLPKSINGRLVILYNELRTSSAGSHYWQIQDEDVVSRIILNPKVVFIHGHLSVFDFEVCDDSLYILTGQSILIGLYRPDSISIIREVLLDPNFTNISLANGDLVLFNDIPNSSSKGKACNYFARFYKNTCVVGPVQYFPEATGTNFMYFQPRKNMDVSGSLLVVADVDRPLLRFYLVDSLKCFDSLSYSFCGRGFVRGSVYAYSDELAKKPQKMFPLLDSLRKVLPNLMDIAIQNDSTIELCYSCPLAKEEQQVVAEVWQRQGAEWKQLSSKRVQSEDDSLSQFSLAIMKRNAFTKHDKGRILTPLHWPCSVETSHIWPSYHEYINAIETSAIAGCRRVVVKVDE